jgi:hypothetical protein
MKNGEGLTDQDYARLHSASSSLAKMLTEVFAQAGLPERNRYILMLRAFAEFMRDLDCPRKWQRRPYELGLALAQLDQGITPDVLRPTPRTDGGRPSDEWRTWIVRSRAVLALEARSRAKVPQTKAVKEIKKQFPTLDAEPFAKKGQLQTSLRNWQRKMGDIKPGDHLDLVAEQHEDARAALANMSPADAISVSAPLTQSETHSDAPC